jgi:hypothetical protein
MTSYKQGDKKWAMMKLGDTNLVMGGSGCFLTAVIDRLTDMGITHDSPGVACEKVNGIKGFDKKGLLTHAAIMELYPAVKKIVSQTTVLFPRPADKQVTMEYALRDITRAMENGNIVILSVDASKHNGVDDGDHFVGLAGINGNEWLIADPITGKVEDITIHYGTPQKSIYGYRILELMSIEHLNVKDGSLITESEIRGEIAYWKDGKLLRGSPTDVLSCWAVDNFGVRVTAKQFNQFPHYDIKHPNLSL